MLKNTEVNWKKVDSVIYFYILTDLNLHGP